MNRLKITGLVVVLAMSLTSIATAQPQDRDVGVFADPGGSISHIQAAPFVPAVMYVLGWNLDGQVKGFEFEIIFGDPSILVLQRNLGAGWLNVGALDNFIVGTGGCLAADGVWFQLVQYQAGFFVPVVPQDVVVCVQASTPSSFAPAVPGYLQCDGTLVPFGVAQNGGGQYPNGCGVINPSTPTPFPISTSEESWGALKSKF